MTDADLLQLAERDGKGRAGKKKAKGKSVEKSDKRRKGKVKHDDCNVPNLNCFTHDNSHWRTEPYWTLGPFCFCQNSYNNSYWCLRTVNSTHNFLYCEFVTGFISFYDMTKDKYQLHNIVYDLSIPVVEQLSAQLENLRKCQGVVECESYGKS
ncbi:unnamed protein product [Soboliphyme baturini]|uniref:CxC2 domain-containing protein n=1 Tax=Soboliphyme baturini TaxID=241478 RepID=A0A183J3J4_9BILA|nr:unnamed protein product [Soboliphyme baturini]